LKDGSEVVAAIVNPHAEAQIRTHFGAVRKMIPDLIAQGIPGIDRSTIRAIELAEAQALSELDMVAEAAKVDRAGEALGRVAQSMQKELGPWKIEVPAASKKLGRYKGVLFTQKAPGSTLNRAKGDAKLLRQAEHWSGQLITRVLFREGLVLSDPHRGNIIVDLSNPNAPALHFIDHGQNVDLLTKPFWQSGSDEVLRFSQFLRSLQAGDPSRIARAGADLAKTPPSAAQLRRAIQLIGETLRESVPPEKLLLRLNQNFEAAGIAIDERYAFNALKGLTTVFQEKYLSIDELTDLMAREATSKLTRGLTSNARSPLIRCVEAALRAGSRFRR
jgi:hypothetical protein